MSGDLIGYLFILTKHLLILVLTSNIECTYPLHTYSNVDKESNDTCYNDDTLRNRRCNFSEDDGTTKEYHSGRLGTYYAASVGAPEIYGALVLFKTPIGDIKTKLPGSY